MLQMKNENARVSFYLKNSVCKASPILSDLNTLLEAISLPKSALVRKKFRFCLLFGTKTSKLLMTFCFYRTPRVIFADITFNHSDSRLKIEISNKQKISFWPYNKKDSRTRKASLLIFAVHLTYTTLNIRLRFSKL